MRKTTILTITLIVLLLAIPSLTMLSPVYAGTEGTKTITISNDIINDETYNGTYLLIYTNISATVTTWNLNITYNDWVYDATASNTSFFDIGIYSKNFSTPTEAGQYVTYQTGISFRNYKGSASGRSLFHNATTNTHVCASAKAFPYEPQLASVNTTILSMTYHTDDTDTLNYTDYTTTDRITPYLVAFKTSTNSTTYLTTGSFDIVISYITPSVSDIVIAWLPSIISLAMLGMVIGILGKFAR